MAKLSNKEMYEIATMVVAMLKESDALQTSSEKGGKKTSAKQSAPKTSAKQSGKKNAVSSKDDVITKDNYSSKLKEITTVKAKNAFVAKHYEECFGTKPQYEWKEGMVYYYDKDSKSVKKHKAIYWDSKQFRNSQTKLKAQTK